ncbi:hypothetical protein CFC21_026129 [Triticum aestivum]|uniref:Protein kinase domain-containing protein n=2 Tax=Triticum aestivum TaxID=4565 RepID=A0A9R1EKT0_WHEAT|nr:hypothetical protein CFC21_026129 [Triticum aestivum]
MWWLPPCFHGGGAAKGEGRDHFDPVPVSPAGASARSMSTATSSTITAPSGSDLTGSINASDLSADSIQRPQQYPSFADRPANLRVFTYAELRAATRNLSRSLMLGEGGFGCVYRGAIKVDAGAGDETPPPMEVAVKHLNRNGLQARYCIQIYTPPTTYSHCSLVALSASKINGEFDDLDQGHKEWLTEVNVLGIVDHPNLVKLVGYCADDDERGAQRLLVYEYMPNRSVDDHLSGRAIGTTLSWPMRLRVALDAAKGLKYLHEDMDFQIIFRDLKTSNILLDEDWNAKLSDFGMAREGPTEGLTHVSTAVVGTLGYAAPEYIQTGRLNAKSDIWSYGVLLYELITGRRPIDGERPRGEQKLLDWVKPYISDTNRLRLIVDPKLEGRYSIKSVAKLVTVANRCLARLPKARPRMGEVLDMVQKAVDVDGGAGAPPLHHYSSGGSREEGGSSKLKQEGKKGFHGQWRGGRGKGPLMC